MASTVTASLFDAFIPGFMDRARARRPETLTLRLYEYLFSSIDAFPLPFSNNFSHWVEITWFHCIVRFVDSPPLSLSLSVTRSAFSTLKFSTWQLERVTFPAATAVRLVLVTGFHRDSLKFVESRDAQLRTRHQVRVLRTIKTIISKSRGAVYLANRSRCSNFVALRTVPRRYPAAPADLLVFSFSIRFPAYVNSRSRVALHRADGEEERTKTGNRVERRGERRSERERTRNRNREEKMGKGMGEKGTGKRAKGKQIHRILSCKATTRPVNRICIQ